MHTYDEVEQMLKKSVGATEQGAKGIALFVDRTGRTVLKQGTKDECRRCQKDVIKMTVGARRGFQNIF